MNNQAIGLLPLLLFIFLDNFFSYKLSFLIAVLFCAASVLAYRLLMKDRVYHFFLIPSSITIVLYSVFLFLRLDPILFNYSPIIIEVLLVVVLAVISFSKRSAFRKLRNADWPAPKKAAIRTALNEYFFLVQIVQSVYTLHLFVILFFTMLPASMKSELFERVLYREMGLILGVLVIIYEQVRIHLMEGKLKREIWIPVLDDSGKVIGCMARSVSRSVARKYYHPIVRVALIYNGMLYLVPRDSGEYISPETLDYPFHKYVIFRQSIEATARNMVTEMINDGSLEPRFLIRYTYEDDKVKHLVSLYAVCLRTEEQFERCRDWGGKLWTSKQIDENLGKGVFSSYFENEYPYLKNTILFAENFRCANKKATSSS